MVFVVSCNSLTDILSAPIAFLGIEFTQGRHRNAKVILLLQNAFPKGKHNTSISVNAQYMAFSKITCNEKSLQYTLH